VCILLQTWRSIADIQGRVKIAKHAITGKYAAIKIVPKQALVESRMSMSEAGARQDKVLLGIEREIVIMKLIDHPNVLNLYDVWETKTELYAISFSPWQC
jgi:serine/threonine-protein kinase HSL1 (negative regulator of Swe1 kinase)